MYVLTIDQRRSRTSDDLVPAVIEDIARMGRLTAAPERTAGDEIQTATDDARLALDIVLHLTRLGTWSVGLGVGAVESPLPAMVRAGRGDAFVRARDAVDRAKGAPGRFALAAADPQESLDAEALVRLLIDLRDRRSPEGWEVHDLLARGRSQKSIAEELGIGASAVSLRARAAGLRIEEAATPALVRTLARLDD